MSYSLQHQEIFRLSAVLYADNNYNISTPTITKKIIESVLCEHNNQPLTFDEIIDYCEQHYNLIFSPKEVHSSISKNSNDFSIVINQRNESLSSLTATRYNAIKEKSKKQIDTFIDIFIQEHSLTYETKEVIYRYLYELLTSNIKSYQSILLLGDNNLKLTPYGKNYTDNEIKIINLFLDWDDNGKNKAIFDLVSYGLEYCLISGKRETSIEHLKNISKKSLYLDTSMIYRLIGINGEQRRKRLVTFFKKCTQTGQKLQISVFTDEEFKQSIKTHIEQLKKWFSNKSINPNLPSYFSTGQDIYYSFHQWKTKRVNPTPDLFQQHILAEYDKLQKDFGINVDYKIPFDLKDKIAQATIDKYESEISQSCGKMKWNCLYDARNIAFLEYKRGTRNTTFTETTYFFVSTDQKLRQWDFQRKNQIPIIILPSQWLAILLRFYGRTQDDFKSFVSFINLNHSADVISPKIANTIIAGISEITQDFQQQENILKVMIETNFDELINQDEEHLQEEVLRQGESILQGQLSEVTNKVEELSFAKRELESRIIDKENEVQKKTEVHQSEVDKLKKQLKQKDDQKKALTDQLLSTYLLQKDGARILNVIVFGITGFFGLILFAACFLYIESPLNIFYASVIKPMDKLTSAQCNLATNAVYASTAGLSLGSFYNVRRLLSKEFIAREMQKYEEEFNRIHKIDLFQ